MSNVLNPELIKSKERNNNINSKKTAYHPVKISKYQTSQLHTHTKHTKLHHSKLIISKLQTKNKTTNTKVHNFKLLNVRILHTFKHPKVKKKRKNIKKNSEIHPHQKTTKKQSPCA